MLHTLKDTLFENSCSVHSYIREMALKYAFLLSVIFVCSECFLRHDNFNKEPIFADKMCPSEQVEFQKVTRSAVSCVRACAESSGCRSLVYLHGNKTCYGIRSDNPFVTASSLLPGAVFYKSDSAQSTTTSTTTPTTTTSTTTSTTSMTTATTTTTTTISTTTTDPVCATTVAMVTSVADNQLSASSEFAGNGGLVYGASQARLGNTVACWTPNTDNTQEYIQVDFVTVRLVEAVVTQGDGIYDEWVTSYMILVSQDCAGYTAVTDPTDNDQVFAGNTDRSSNATNVLGPSVTCRCLRINPVTWYDRIAMRFEVNGCEI